MAKIIWLDEAKDDVRGILEYLVTSDAMAAVRNVAGVDEAAERLAAFPLSGRHYNKQFRSIVFRNHLIFYRFDEPTDTVHIAAVIDGRRDLDHLMGKME